MNIEHLAFHFDPVGSSHLFFSEQGPHIC